MAGYKCLGPLRLSCRLVDRLGQLVGSPLVWNATVGLGMSDISLLGLICKGTTKLGTMLGSARGRDPPWGRQPDPTEESFAWGRNRPKFKSQAYHLLSVTLDKSLNLPEFYHPQLFNGDIDSFLQKY